MKKVAILGSGIVGQTLARGFLKYRNEVVIGTHNPGKKLNWEPPPASLPTVTTYEQAAQSAEILVLAVKGTVAEDVAKTVAHLAAGKTVIDATNPIADLPPENGVLRFFTSLDQSLMERLQKLVPQAALRQGVQQCWQSLHGESRLRGNSPNHVHLRKPCGSKRGCLSHP